MSSRNIFASFYPSVNISFKDTVVFSDLLLMMMVMLTTMQRLPFL